MDSYIRLCSQIVTDMYTPIVNSAKAELTNGLFSMLGTKPNISKTPRGSSFIMLGILGKNEYIDREILESEKEKVCKDGYIIKTIDKEKERFIIIASKTEKGILYGAFAFLRFMQMQRDIDNY